MGLVKKHEVPGKILFVNCTNLTQVGESEEISSFKELGKGGFDCLPKT